MQCHSLDFAIPKKQSKNVALFHVEYIDDWAMKAIEYLKAHGSFQKVVHRVPTATENFVPSVEVAATEVVNA